MVLGFMIFWPIGVAVFVYKMWRRKTGADDLQTFVTAKWNEARGSWARSPAWGWSSAATGNAAFDQWKAAELARLEAERRKLEDAAREFADFLDNIRHAKDREEFDRFMASGGRSRKASPPASPLPQAGEAAFPFSRLREKVAAKPPDEGVQSAPNTRAKIVSTCLRW